MSTAQETRQKMNSFYAALRANDIEALDQLMEEGLPLKQAMSFLPESLPEYAMKHGSVEAAWWLMSQDIMPENWSSFTGDAWKTFLKKGWDLALKKDGGISMSAYKEILKVGMKKTGQGVPSFMDKTVRSVSGSLGDLIARARSAAEAFVKDIENDNEASASSPSTTPREAPEEKATENRAAPSVPSTTLNKLRVQVHPHKVEGLNMGQAYRAFVDLTTNPLVANSHFDQRTIKGATVFDFDFFTQNPSSLWRQMKEEVFPSIPGLGHAIVAVESKGPHYAENKVLCNFDLQDNAVIALPQEKAAEPEEKRSKKASAPQKSPMTKAKRPAKKVSTKKTAKGSLDAKNPVKSKAKPSRSPKPVENGPVARKPRGPK